MLLSTKQALLGIVRESSDLEQTQLPKAAKHLWGAFDRAFSQGEFDAVDETLAEIDIKSTGHETLYELLSITKHARNHLASRQSFFQQVDREFHARNLDRQFYYIEDFR